MAPFLALFFLLIPVVHVLAQQPGFLSIDCGLDAMYSGYTDPSRGIFYVSDEPYVDAGENHMVAAEYQGPLNRYLQTLRSFPSGLRNCYALPTKAGDKYLVRVEIFYGNYDGKNSSSSVEFDLHLGPHYWETASPGHTYEALFVAWAAWTPVCLVNTGRGTPFVSAVELRPMGALYPPVSPALFMSAYSRQSLGPNVLFTRYPDDTYDRYWMPMVRIDPLSTNLSTTGPIRPDPRFMEPLPVLQTAVAAASNETTLTITWRQNKKSYSFMPFLHFADFQNSRLREFDIYFNGDRLGASDKPHSPAFMVASCVYSTDTYRPTTDDIYNITLAATAMSVLPPILNALEIYTVIPNDNPITFPKDFEAIMAIKLEYGVKKNWMGDPCFPTKFAWEGVKCSNTSDNTMRITSLDLSNSSLHGVVSMNFTLLTALQNLDLSYNNLSGSISDSLPSLPSLQFLNLSGNHLSGDALCKNYTRLLVFRYDFNEYMCDKKPSQSRNKATVITISVVVPALVVAVILLAYFICRKKTKPRVSTHDRTGDTQLVNEPGNIITHEDQLHNTENRRFTYKELEELTNNFNRFIGKGGFGLVYYGCLGDGTEVAVKMRSESSTHGLDEFLAEVQSLTRIHHRNLVSLVGYCWEGDHLALVYEYMPKGTLYDHLRGKDGDAESLNWGSRVRVVLEAAQGLDYLHKGCSLPIIHRDVKSNNILLGKNLQAKIADFGLCKTYATDTQTHVSATAAGTPGYIDPEYFLTGRLTESSDVYSFGIVLLEVATGEAPMVPGNGHIVQRVKQKISTGNISLIADAQLRGAYDVSSMWKVLDIAMMCTADSAAHRPTMATVVAQLRESLALEEAREESTVWATGGSNEEATLSTCGPLAR